MRSLVNSSKIGKFNTQTRRKKKFDSSRYRNLDLSQSDGNLPEKAGIIWAMPLGDSQPGDQKFEVGFFLNGLEKMTKSYFVLDYEGEVIQLPASWINGVFANAYQIEAEGMKVTVWINGETQLPVSLTVESPYVDGKRTFVLEAKLEFNQLLDPALFDLNPSDEYKLVNGDN